MSGIRYSKYLPWVFMYFFLNTIPGLPAGLFTTCIFAPYFYWWLLRQRCTYVLELYFACLFPFFLAALYVHAKIKDFAVSSLLLMTVYVSAYAIAMVVRKTRMLESMFRVAIWGHFCLSFVGMAVRFTSHSSLMWQTYSGTDRGSLRYQGLSYEPAQFSLLIVPLALFCYWQLVYRGWTRKNLVLAFAVLVPLLMAFSFGAIGAMGISLVLIHLFYGKGFKRVKWTLILGTVGILGFLALPSSSHLKIRAMAIISGTDSSENSRTTASYFAAWEEAKHTSIWVGGGLGQTKDNIHYTVDETGKIPCAIAGTFAELGILGLILRFGLEIYFFIRTKPYENAYRLSLFMLMFLLQFGASFSGNIVEYATWILAFTPSVDFFAAEEVEDDEEAAIELTPAHQVA